MENLTISESQRHLFKDLYIPDFIRNDPGVYLICDILLTKAYVGSSKNLRFRLQQHKSKLKNGNHENQRVQNFYDTNQGDLYLIIVEFDDIEKARTLEQQILNQPPKNCTLLNVAKDAWVSSKGLSPTASTRKKISMSSIGHKKPIEMRLKLKEYWNNPEVRDRIRKVNLGVKRSPEVGVKIAKAQSQMIEGDGVQYTSMKEAAEKLGVAQSTITHRINNPKYPAWRKI